MQATLYRTDSIISTSLRYSILDLWMGLFRAVWVLQERYGYLVKERLDLRGGSLDLVMKAAEVPKDLQPLLRSRMR